MEPEICIEANVDDTLLGKLKLSTDDKNIPVSKTSETELTSFSEEDGEGMQAHDEEVSARAKTVSILEQV